MKHFFFSNFLAGWLLVVNLNITAQNRSDLKRFGEWIKDDPVSLFQNAGPEQLVKTGTAGMAIISLSVFDEPSSRQFQQSYKYSRFLDITNAFGDKKLAFSASAAIFGSSLLTDNTKFQDAAFTSLESVLITYLAVSAGKFLFARSRPGDDDGAYDFDFVQTGETSFPSGHASTAFALVTPWIMYYPHPLTYSLLAIPAGTSIARIAKGKHWLSDVTAGAAIGFSMSYYLSKKHLNAVNEHVKVTPVFGTNFASMAIHIRF